MNNNQENLNPNRNSDSEKESISNGAGKSVGALREEAILEFWQKEGIFEKTLEKNKNGNPFVFFEGPPTANAKPALHHLEARAFKDVIPRYKTMQGFNVPRRAGWDTHGLPVELQIEKKLGLTSKKDIAEYGIAKFNRECRESVFEFIGDWERFTDRIGYWVDKSSAYYTFDTNYIESLWSIMGRVNDQGLLYKDYRVVPWCSRCGTALASHELAQGYEDVKDLSVYAKFKAKIKSDLPVYLIAWTTTPWTLSDNVALAVGENIKYVWIKKDNEILIVAEEKKYLIEGPYDIVDYIYGSELVSMEYEPVFTELQGHLQFSELQKDKFVDHKNGWHIYVAPFVTTTEGTGIVHIASMYGNDDFELATKKELPKVHTVDEAGKFISAINPNFLIGKFVRDEEVAIDIIKNLAHRGLLFKKEKYEHSYPHCWRCKTPLIYYARDSWYIKMSSLREKLIKENESINWEPSHIQTGRFGEWIRDVKDWAISRERYWGTPLPVWQSADGERIVIDSFNTLKKYTKKSGNKYHIMRHGESVANVDWLVSSVVTNNDPLTEKGKSQVQDSIKKINFKPDIIIASPFMRTKQTAEMVAKHFGVEVVYDNRLGEVGAGEFEGKNWHQYHDYLYGKDRTKWFSHKIPGGESLQDVLRRVGEALYEVENKYQNKNILFVTHGGPAWLAYVASGEFMPNGQSYSNEISNGSVFVKNFKRFANAEVRELNFVPLPHNENYELDPHRPFIDEVVLEKDGKKYSRVKEVMDVWFDSGSMPFAQDHYLFKKQNWFSKLFKNEKTIQYPADFISEAIDQTRGWFYTLHAVGALTGWGKAYKNVICLGHLLDAQGKKMSKSIGNIVDPWMMMDKYGVDTLRLWMYSVNQPGDSKNFDEKTVKELEGKVFTLLYNVLSFYELYRDKGLENGELNSKNVLDKWIIAKTNAFVANTTRNLDNYKLFEPVRELRDFIGDVSTWYLRRSRERLKSSYAYSFGRTQDGDADAKQTLYFVLKTAAKIMAPFAPFTADDIWQKLRNENDEISVHLANWPKAENFDEQILADMDLVRNICTEGNALRKKTNIPVRQPLSKLIVYSEQLKEEYFDLLKEELNVKNIELQTTNFKLQTRVDLDTNITDDLKREGNYRELVRALQDMRKDSGLTPEDVIVLTISKNAEGLVKEFINDLKKTVQIRDINFADSEKEIVIAGETYKISIQK